jgi:hypothetical protein
MHVNSLLSGGGIGVCSTHIHTHTHVPNTPLDRLKKAIQIGVEVMYSREHTFHLFEPPGACNRFHCVHT